MGWVGICPSVTKRYEGVGGVTSALRNVIFVATTAWFGEPLGLPSAPSCPRADTDVKIIWLSFPMI